MFLLKKNKDFISQRDVVICYLVHNDQMLFLRRALDKFKGGFWTAPGGKRENNESLDDSVVREIYEETNVVINKKDISFIDKCYIKHDDFHFTMHIYKTQLTKKPDIILNNENIEYAWKSVQDAKKLKLIEYASDCLDLTFNKNQF
jgi:8-oxo-dGTP diphosphatase